MGEGDGSWAIRVYAVPRRFARTLATSLARGPQHPRIDVLEHLDDALPPDMAVVEVDTPDQARLVVDVRRSASSPPIVTFGPPGADAVVEACVHAGSVGHFELPATRETILALADAFAPRPDPAAAPTDEPPSPGAEVAPLSAVVVEDDTLVAEVLASLLGTLGVEATTASTRRQAVAAFEIGGFDLVLCDYQMVDLNHHEVLELAARHAPNAYLVIVSGVVRRVPESVAFRLKPLTAADLSELVSLARQHVSSGRREP